MVDMENEECFVSVEVSVAGEWKVLRLFDGSLSGFEDVEVYQQLGQHVQDGRRFSAMSFLQLSELTGCCKCGSSERQLPNVRLLVVQIQAGL